MLRVLTWLLTRWKRVDLPKPSTTDYIDPRDWAKVYIHYRDISNQLTEREIDVFKIDNGAVQAYCHLRGAMRIFRFSSVDDDYGVTNRVTGENVPVWEWEKRLKGKWLKELPKKRSYKKPR